MNIIDPLAQSFYIEEESGIFVTSVDLYFQSKDVNLPVTIQLRPIELGLPTDKVYPFSEIVLNPSSVNLSQDASVPTRVYFKSPIYLTGQKFHSIVLLSNSDRYNVWVSKLGEPNTSTDKILVYKQPLSGGLFKSQNATTWNESPYEDLKFTLYRAKFNQTSGNINLYNPDLSLGNNQVATLLSNSLEFSSRKIRVGLGSTLQDNDLKLGNTIIQPGTNASGNYVGSAGTSTGTLRIINAGIGYTPSSGSLTFSNVSLSSITGNGKNATANITISNGVAIAATISNGGRGYSIGDVVTATQIGALTLGRNLQLSIQTINGSNEIILDNVQGDFEAGVAKSIYFINSSGITTALNSSVGGNVRIISDGIQVESDGLHVRVNHKNHGMHATENVVRISKVSSDIKPIKITEEYSSSSTSDINVDGTINFSTFENIGIGTTNPGYALIGNEIIAYTGTTATSLTGITRGIDQTLSSSYSSGTQVYKYELNGISLRRINTTHSLQDSTISDSIDLDYYTIKIDTSQDGKTQSLPLGQVDRSLGTNFPKLYANQSKSTGGNLINATQNIQYEIVRPNIQTMILNGTNISAKMRTVSGTSVDGNENSFEDKGYADIGLDKNNYFNSPRIVCSKVNEDTLLSTLPGNKSLNVNLTLTTTNSSISPVIDLDRLGMIFVSNRINNPIQNYVTDNRVNTLKDDPSAFVYATNIVELEIPATSIKVLVTAYINNYSDLRALYAIQNELNSDMIYYPFPGYTNLNSSGQVINYSQSDGREDKKIIKTDKLGFESFEIPFKEYEFTIDSLAPFKYFSVKLVGSSTNQAFPPRIKDLRVIALA